MKLSPESEDLEVSMNTGIFFSVLFIYLLKLSQSRTLRVLPVDDLTNFFLFNADYKTTKWLSYCISGKLFSGFKNWCVY